MSTERRCPLHGTVIDEKGWCNVLVGGEPHAVSEPTAYEWCVMHRQYPQEPHRGPMTEAEARSWVREVVAEGAVGPGVFYVARRVVLPWERVA